MYFVGQRGVGLRREGYSSNLTTWRRQRSKVTWKRFPQNIVAQRQQQTDPPLVLLNRKVKTTILNKNSNRQKPLLTSKNSEILQRPLGSTGEKI